MESRVGGLDRVGADVAVFANGEGDVGVRVGEIEEVVAGWGLKGCKGGEGCVEMSEGGRGLRGGVCGERMGEWEERVRTTFPLSDTAVTVAPVPFVAGVTFPEAIGGEGGTI